VRFLRFSIRRLLLLTGLIAVLLYLLFIRPVKVANDFVQTVRTADPKEIGKYLDNMKGESPHVEYALEERSWADVFSFRQTFAISVVRPVPGKSTIEEVENHPCCGTPFGVAQQQTYVTAREKHSGFEPFTHAQDKMEILAAITAVRKGDRIQNVVKNVGHTYSTEPYEIEEMNGKYGTRLVYDLTDTHGRYEDIVFWFGNDDRLVRVTNTIAKGPSAPPGQGRAGEIELGK
jgi:hypothetical protein